MKQLYNILTLDEFIAESKLNDLKNRYAYLWDKTVAHVAAQMEDDDEIYPDDADDKIEKQARKYIKGYLLQLKEMAAPEALVDYLVKDVLAKLQDDRYWKKKKEYEGKPLDSDNCIKIG